MVVGFFSSQGVSGNDETPRREGLSELDLVAAAKKKQAEHVFRVALAKQPLTVGDRTVTVPQCHADVITSRHGGNP
jgi:hypothetical protein